MFEVTRRPPRRARTDSSLAIRIEEGRKEAASDLRVVEATNKKPWRPYKRGSPSELGRRGLGG